LGPLFSRIVGGLEHPDAAALEQRLASALVAGQSAWPRVVLSEERFIEHLAEHAAKASSPLGFLESVHAADLYLACAAALGDRAAVTAFEEQFMAHVDEYVLRVRMPSDAVDEVKQKLRERLLMGGGEPPRRPKLAEYSGKGALGGWLRVAAVRTALNELRGRDTKTEELADEAALADDPELAFVRERASGLFGDAFARVLAGMSPTERTILRQHYIDGLTLDQLAQLHRTPRSTLARRIADAREEILSATEGLLREERRLSPSSIVSVIRQARSRLDITITRLLR
jgi:RNA polymerase sigma-70 factor (ECF subfamily)